MDRTSSKSYGRSCLRHCSGINWTTGCVKAPGFDDRKGGSINSIQPPLRSIEPRELSRNPVVQFIPEQCLRSLVPFLTNSSITPQLKIIDSTSHWNISKVMIKIKTELKILISEFSSPNKEDVLFKNWHLVNTT